MKLFWKINIYVSIAVVGIFLLYFILGYYGFYIPDFLLDIPAIIFFYGPFLEIIQIPLCLLVALFTLKRQKKTVWLYFLMMMIFFIIKISIYVLVLGSIVPLNSP